MGGSPASPPEVFGTMTSASGPKHLGGSATASGSVKMILCNSSIVLQLFIIVLQYYEYDFVLLQYIDYDFALLVYICNYIVLSLSYLYAWLS